jgi:hypothetical protein
VGLLILRSSLVAAEPEIFPLSVHASGRYLVDAQGDPFLIHGDTPWSLAAQLTDAEITTYLEDTANKGFKAILFNAIEHYFTSQDPDYDNVDGNQPFTSMTDFASGLVSAYWSRVDHIVNTAKTHGIVCVINPAYLGFASTEEGWDTEVSAESDADLQAYGAALANRYTQGNVIWCMGGDQDPNGTLEAKQWQIITGIRSVRTTDLVTAHGAPGTGAYAIWNGQTGFNLNTAYPGDTAAIYSECATEYGRAGPIPFLMLEGIYEQERASPISAAGLRRQSYQALLSGACGQFFGNSPIWHFESPNAPFSYTGTWESNLDSTGRQQQAHVRTLFDTLKWHLYAPVTDTSLVSSSLSTGDTRICPALASDGTEAAIWVPSSQTITVNTEALTGVAGNVRIRRFNVTNGTFTTIDASVAKSSSDSVATGGEGVIVIDAA